ncbi:MAG: hypothetical protein LBF86_01590 [Helicobacteraceae bacterium]|nr:hypothetical protein [Helicobacteraceae bacterium]
MRSVLGRGICLASIFTVGSFGGKIADGTNAIRNGDYEQARAIFQTACDDNNASF